MKSENPENAHGSDRIKSYVSLATQADNGHLDSLECPICHCDSVSAWFSHPAAGVFRTWFICKDCGFSTRAQQATQPRFFTQSRQRQDLEERDREVLNDAILKRQP